MVPISCFILHRRQDIRKDQPAEQRLAQQRQHDEDQLRRLVPVDPAQLKELVDAKGVEEDEHCRDNSIDKVWRRNCALAVSDGEGKQYWQPRADDAHPACHVRDPHDRQVLALCLVVDGSQEAVLLVHLLLRLHRRKVLGKQA